jgi:hypothetical protein
MKTKSVQRATSGKTRRRRSITFTGEEFGAMIVNYLNRKDRPVDDPIEKLVDLFQWPPNPHAIVDFSRDAVARRPHLRLQTERFLSVTPEGTVELRNEPIYTHKGPVSPIESDVMLAWNRCFISIERGLLDRVRRCKKEDCREWFFARYRHAMFHDKACRIAVENANPEYMERRREHLRKIREEGRKKGGKR